MDKLNDATAHLPALQAIAATRDYVTTNEAATLLNRKPQTLRKWACLENGPLRPIRIYGRLMWCIKELAALLSGNTSALCPTFD